MKNMRVLKLVKRGFRHDTKDIEYHVMRDFNENELEQLKSKRELDIGQFVIMANDPGIAFKFIRDNQEL